MKLLPTWIACALFVACATTPDDPRAPRSGAALAQDGVAIVYEERGEGDTTLVFIHCWAGNRAFWSRELALFADRYRVIALDLPGHGASGSARSEWTVADLAADVESVVDAAHARRVILIGHSMGGPIALDAARRLRGRVIGVIGVDTLHDAELVFPRETADGIAQRFETDFEGTIRAAIDGMMPPDADPAAREFVVKHALATPRVPAVALLRDFANVDARALFRHAGVPVRCINKAPLSPTDARTKVDTNRRYADFDVIEMEGVGHYPMIERGAEFDVHLARWVAELDLR